MANTDAVVGNRVVARGRVIARRVKDGRPEVILAIIGGNGNRNNKLAFTYEHQIGNFAFGDEVIVKVANVDLENQEIDFKILKHKSLISKK